MSVAETAISTRSDSTGRSAGRGRRLVRRSNDDNAYFRPCPYYVASRQSFAAVASMGNIYAVSSNGKTLWHAALPNEKQTRWEFTIPLQGGQGSQDAYRALGLPLDAPPTEVKSAYRRLALATHPDRNPGDKDATAKFRLIQGAYERILAGPATTGASPSGVTVSMEIQGLWSDRQLPRRQRRRRRRRVLTGPTLCLRREWQPARGARARRRPVRAALRPDGTVGAVWCSDALLFFKENKIVNAAEALDWPRALTMLGDDVVLWRGNEVQVLDAYGRLAVVGRVLEDCHRSRSARRHARVRRGCADGVPTTQGRVMRILLVSDVHLDSPFAWAKLEVARRRRQALRDALARSIQLAIDQRVDVICCGGDLFEHERVSPDTGQFLRVQFERAHPIPIFIAPGNHDWLGQESLYRRISWTPNVHVFDDRRLTPVPIVDGLTLWGGAHFAPAGTPDFLERFPGRPRRHSCGSVSRVRAGFLLRRGCKASNRMPRSEPTEIEASGLHFALLGHYHAPRDEKRFTYPGNPEPLTFGESGQRGVVIVTIGDDGRVTTDRHSVAVSDVYDLEIEVSGCASKQEIRDRVAAALEGRGGYARLTLTGELAPDVDLHAADFERSRQQLSTHRRSSDSNP